MEHGTNSLARSGALLLISVVAVAAGCVSPVGGELAAGHRARAIWTPEKQLAVRRVTSPMISPSGEVVVFEVAHADLEVDRWERRLHWARCDGSGVAVLLPCHGAADPHWGADDSTLFVRAPDEQGCERVHVLDLGSGELAPVSPEGESVGGELGAHPLITTHTHTHTH